ncbi:MAG: aminotransferase class V-fold PLP-dependent enzyme [Gammaproteobacteria bacterium]
MPTICSAYTSTTMKALDDNDIRQLRDDTPACEKLIHFNNAGSSIMPQPVYQSVLDHLATEQTLGGYEAASLAPLDQFYLTFAELLNADPREMAFVENATRAWDMAFYSLPLNSGDRVLTHVSEYASNYLALLQLAKRRNIKIDVAPSDASGQVDVEAMEALITPDTKLIALTHVPSQGGLVNPATEVGALAKKHKLFYLLDACQSVGQLHVDVKAIGCHMLSGTGRKFLRGPRGTGFLYVSRDIIDQLDPPFIDLHSAHWNTPATFEWADDAIRFENFESFVAGRIGLTAAARYAMNIGLDRIETRVELLADYLRMQLSNVPGMAVHDLGRKRCGIVTFTKQGEDAFDVKKRLSASQINISVTPSSYAQLDLGERELPAVARASVHYFNTQVEIERFCEVLVNPGES